MKEIRIDLGKVNLPLYIIATLALLTVISSFFEGSHVAELNSLPINRTELTNIKNISIMFTSKNFFKVDLFIDYIFDVSLEEHYKYMNLRVYQAGIEYRSSTNVLNDYAVNRQVSWYYLNPVYGNATIRLYRGNIFVAEENMTNLVPSNLSNTGFSCVGKDTKDRECEFSNVCYNAQNILYTSFHTVTSPLPILQLSDLISFSPKQISMNVSQNAAYKLETNITYNERIVVIAFNSFSLYSWDWIYNTATPLINAINDVSDIDRIHAIGAPSSVINSSFCNLFGKMEPLEDQLICNKYTIFKQLKPQPWGTVIQSKKIVLQKINEKVKKPTYDCIILEGGSHPIKFDNMNEIAQDISKLNPKTIDINITDDVEVIYYVSHAKYIFTTSGSTSSLVFWVNQGKFFEFVPSGFENVVNGQLPAEFVNASYYHYVVSQNETKLFDSNQIYNSTEDVSLNTTFTIHPFEFIP
ncbi:hypothetical protein TVAG_269350 [Trichomonas vaginalis G3]|uniref:Uncharacterized protein n=1 Tax=Trichomonas vaginalis (strain ATCC PRA-98 / G3) TaxID=412133 RepID=A2EG48_TRIV3|nr:hypothetical protein TVAGG3_0841690 [Trichomonas vaginalis G3]EAY08409.1 hypothetical protein TVAG_269350 [Trichomonas vaginalis G3]KAI5499308.1 hypothetical protein TVAGG3_0841690 [Trichomonas vaginalis G3]|eukprot:XP_001320632.1 hypothetical protein [Trichomonas vaginalis G3]